MRRFFVDKITGDQGLFSITGQEAKHISKVLRMRPGDRLVLTDGEGTRFQAAIERVSPAEVLVCLEKQLFVPPPSSLRITLCQGILKSGAMDFMVQKTSELGVDRIIPFFSERTVVRLEQDRASSRVRHWLEVAKSSTKQSGRTKPVEIAPPRPFKDIVTEWNSGDTLKVILWEEENTEDFKTVLQNAWAGTQLVVMIGPEGGFAKEEVDAARREGFVSVTLGKRILRAETAALVVTAIAQYELGDLSLPEKTVP